MHFAFIIVMSIVGIIASYVFYQMITNCIKKGNCCINCLRKSEV